MTVGIDDGKFHLIDNFPGIPTNGPNPDDFTAFDSPTAFAAGTFNVGEKRQIHDTANNGWSILIYLQFNKGAVPVVAVKGLCGLTTAEITDAGGWGNVTNDFSECEAQGPIAVALGTGTDLYYGWFWCGGVCPVGLVSGLDGIFPSDGTITAGMQGLKLVDSSSATQFRITTASSVSSLVAGISLAVDETS